MTPELPTDPRKALEASLTALWLGELPEDQARFLDQAIATDPELAKTFESLKKTASLIREAQATTGPDTEEAAAPLRLSEERRTALLQQFKTIQPSEFRRPSRSLSSWLVPVAAAVALLLVLTSLMLPSLARTKSRSQARSGESSIGRLTQLSERRFLDRAKPLPKQKSAEQLAQFNDQNQADTLAAPSAGNVVEDLTSLNQQNEGLRKPRETPKGATQAAPLTDSLGLAEGRKPASLTSEALPNPGNGIVLPSLSQSDEITVASAGQPAERGLQFDTFARPEKSGLPPAQNLDTTFAFGQGGGLAGASQSAPILGDRPDLGRAFQLQDKDQKMPASSPTAQLATNALAWHYDQSTFYRGADFGGYSTITPLPAAEPAQLASAPGIGQVPVSRQRAEDGEKTVLEERLAEAKPAAQVEFETKSKVEAGKEITLLQNIPKAEPETLKRSLAGANESADKYYKYTDLRSKLGKAEVGGKVNREDDLAMLPPAAPASVPQPEVATRSNPFSTFSLNVSDVSFKLAAASLEQGTLPAPGNIRSEEFINAFDYRDPEPATGAAVGFTAESAQDPFAQNRDLLRFSVKTAAAGRQSGRPLNLVLLLDNSGSMERADRVQIIGEALRVLAAQLHPQDTFSVVTFARTARLWVDGVPGDQAGRVADDLSHLTPQGGTNLEEAMNLAYQTALRHYNAGGINRVVLLTDGAANLGDTNPEVLRQKVESNRKQGIALDCFGIGWEGFNDTLLEELTRHGDGRYGFVNSPEEAASGFVAQLAGALQVAASDVKVQVEFNPNRVNSYRQVGYAQHQLTQEQFRDNTVDAAEIGAAEAGNAIYVIETNPAGDGPLATVRVRYKLPGTSEYREQEWSVPFSGKATPLGQASPAMRLAATSSAFSEWLAQSPFATEVTPDRLLGYLNGVPAVYGVDPRPQKLEWMIRQAKTVSGK
jgi:Mg-chelatase subunit ChlD